VVHLQSYIIDPHFGRDGKACGIVNLGGEMRLLEVEPGREYRTLVAGLGAGRSEYHWADIGPDDLLAVAMEDGVRIWDLDTGREVAFLPIGLVKSASFVLGGRGRELLSCGPTTGLHRWPIGEEAAAPGRLRIGSPRKVRLPMAPSIASVDQDGHTALVACESSGAAVVLDLADEAVRCTLPHPAVSYGMLSPDGRWAATAGWNTPSVKVWDARTGALAEDLTTGSQNAVYFSPDGRTMITSLVGKYQFRGVPSWRPIRELHWEVPSYPGWVAFSPDRKLVALELSPAVVHLLDAASGRTLARLQDSDRARWLGFTADGGRLVVVSGYSKAIHVWDLRAISRRLGAMGLRDEWMASLEAGGPVLRPGRTVEICSDASASLADVLEQKARATIDRYRQEVATRPGDALACNNLTWSYLLAPEPLRDAARGLAMAERAARLEPGKASYRNTLGVAYYRAGRYGEAIEVLRVDLDGQEDRYLAWDLCFLAMSYHRLGDRDRAREYRSWALRWSRDQTGLSADHLHELSAIRAEMEATLAR
jgi:WD40 repeat protein